MLTAFAAVLPPAISNATASPALPLAPSSEGDIPTNTGGLLAESGGFAGLLDTVEAVADGAEIVPRTDPVTPSIPSPLPVPPAPRFVSAAAASLNDQPVPEDVASGEFDAALEVAGGPVGDDDESPLPGEAEDLLPDQPPVPAQAQAQATAPVLVLALAPLPPPPTEAASAILGGARGDDAGEASLDEPFEERPGGRLDLMTRARELYSPRHDRAESSPSANPGLPSASPVPLVREPSQVLPGATDQATSPLADLAEPPLQHAPASAPRPVASVPAQSDAAGFAAPSADSSPSSEQERTAQKKEAQPILRKGAISVERAGGTEAALSPSTMVFAPAKPASTAVPAATSASGAVRTGVGEREAPSGMASERASAASSLSPLAASGVPTSVGAPILSTPEVAPSSGPLPASAVRLIERVGEIAEQAAARPGEPVRVSLDLAGEHRVEVKVSVRGGRVFTDFRTNSAEMRQALSQAWEGFARSREAGAQRWAEPVFSVLAPAAVSPAAPAPVAASGGSAGDSAFAGHDAPSDHHAPRRDPAAPEFGLPTGRAASPRHASPSAAAATPGPSLPNPTRPDGSRHFHAHA